MGLPPAPRNNRWAEKNPVDGQIEGPANLGNGWLVKRIEPSTLEYVPLVTLFAARQEQVARPKTVPNDKVIDSPVMVTAPALAMATVSGSPVDNPYGGMVLGNWNTQLPVASELSERLAVPGAGGFEATWPLQLQIGHRIPLVSEKLKVTLVPGAGLRLTASPTATLGPPTVS
jgi:hypothetical protein